MEIWVEKLYIILSFEHLLASNFTESLFLKCSNAYKILYHLLDVYFRQIFSKVSEKSVCGSAKADQWIINYFIINILFIIYMRLSVAEGSSFRDGKVR